MFEKKTKASILRAARRLHRQNEKTIISTIGKVIDSRPELLNRKDLNNRQLAGYLIWLAYDAESEIHLPIKTLRKER